MWVVGLIILLIFGGLAVYFIQQAESHFNEESNDGFREDLSDIFYQYKHNSVAEWRNWILAADKSDKNEALELILIHLSLSPNNWNQNTAKAVSMIPLLAEENALSELQNLAEDLLSKSNDNEYAGLLSVVYEQFAYAVIQTNDEESKEYLFELFFELANNGEISTLCPLGLLTPIFELEYEQSIGDFYTNILTDESLSIDLRTKVFNYLFSSQYEGPSVMLLLNEVIDYYIELSKWSDDKVEAADFEFLKQVFERFMLEPSEERWSKVIPVLKNKILRAELVDIIAGALSNPINNIDQKDLFEIYSLSHRSIEEALCERNQITESEMTIVGKKNLDFKLLDESMLKSPDNMPLMYVPSELEERYRNLDLSLSDSVLQNSAGDFVKGKGILIGGSAELEKLYLSRKLADIRDMNFCFVDFASIPPEHESPAAYLDSESQKIPKPYLLYIKNLQAILIGDDKDTRNKVLQIIDSVASHPKIYIIATVPDSATNKDNQPEYLRRAPRHNIPVYIDFDNISHDEKDQIIGSYLHKLGEERTTEEFSRHHLVAKFKDISSLEFCARVLDYFKASLLTAGTLLSLNEQQKLLAREAQEV